MAQLQVDIGRDMSWCDESARVIRNVNRINMYTIQRLLNYLWKHWGIATGQIWSGHFDWCWWEVDSNSIQLSMGYLAAMLAAE